MAFVLSKYEQITALSDAPPVEAVAYGAMGDTPRSQALHRLIPSPPRPQPTITAADSEAIICGMTRDRGTIFATTAAGQLRKSTNENVSWSNVGSAFPAQVQWVTELDDGELLVTVTATGGAGGGVWKSSGWPDGSPTFTLVHSATADTYFTGDWGNDAPWNTGVVVLAEYGAQGVARRVWKSKKNGKAGSWFLLFTHPGTATGDGGAHTHGGCHDPYFKRDWVVGGDDTNRGVWYSDDDGETWTEVQSGRNVWKRGVNAGAVQFVGVKATRAGIVFTTDSAPNGVFFAPRHRKEDAPYIRPLKILSESADLQQIGRRMFHNGPDSELLIAMSQQTGSGASYLMALHPEGAEAEVLWKSETDYAAAGGLRAVVGPTAGGYYFGSIQNTTWFTARWKAPEWRVRSSKAPSRTVTSYVRHSTSTSALVAAYLSQFNFTGNELRIRYRGRLDDWAVANKNFAGQWQGGAAGKVAWRILTHTDGRPGFFSYNSAGTNIGATLTQSGVTLATVFTAGDWGTVEFTFRKNTGGGVSDFVTRRSADYDPRVDRGYSKGTWLAVGTTQTNAIISTLDTAATSGLSFNSDFNGNSGTLAGDFEWGEIWMDGVLIAAVDVRDGQLTPGDRVLQATVVKPDLYGAAGEVWNLVGAATVRGREELEDTTYYDRYLKLTDVTAMPPVPTGGGVLYTVAGQLRYRGSGGTITNLGNA